MDKVHELYRRHRLQILCGLYVLVLGVGVGLAMLWSDDPRWMGWSLSRLGEASVNRHSANAFNAGVLASSCVLVIIGVRMVQGYMKLNQPKTARWSGWLMMLMAVCMTGVALFPNDTMHAQHFAVSRGVVVSMLLLMLTLPSSLSYLTKRERKLAYCFPIFAGLLVLQGYILQSFWFVIIEVVLGVMAGTWLFFVCRDLDVRLHSLNK